MAKRQHTRLPAFRDLPIGMPVRIKHPKHSRYGPDIIGVVTQHCGDRSTPMVMVRWGPEPHYPETYEEWHSTAWEDPRRGTELCYVWEVERALQVLRGGKGQREQQEQAL